MATPERRPVILLVEDESDTATLIKVAFRKAGFTNTVADVRDGQEAIEYLLGEGKFGNRAEYPLPQLILLDLKMPRMNGIEFLQWLRAWPPAKGVPVVVLTGSTLGTDLKEAYHAGANSYLVKGADAHELVEQMSTIGAVWLSGQVRLPDSPE